MFDQDDFKTKKEKDAPKINNSIITISSDQQIFGFYLEESAQVRKRYGIGRNEGKYFIENLELINNLDSALKEKLREWVLAKKREGKFSEVKN